MYTISAESMIKVTVSRNDKRLSYEDAVHAARLFLARHDLDDGFNTSIEDDVTEHDGYTAVVTFSGTYKGPVQVEC